MATVTKKFTGLTNGKTYYAKVFTVNPKKRVNNRSDLKVASATPKAQALVLVDSAGYDSSIFVGSREFTGDKLGSGSSTFGPPRIEYDCYGRLTYSSTGDEVYNGAFGIMYTMDKIDLTPFNKLIVSGYSDGYLTVGATNNTDTIAPAGEAWVASKRIQGADTVLHEIDVSGLNGAYYIAIRDYEPGHDPNGKRISGYITTLRLE